MKALVLLCILHICLNSIAQNVGIGTSTPANRLDVAGLNNWDLANSEGDMRIGNSTYRLKFGVALAGGGAGTAAIMQHGGVPLLSIGSNGSYQLQLNGSDNSVNVINNASLKLSGNGLLQFPALLSKKIILYPGSTGDASLGVFGNELRIASDYSGADITFGYDNRTSGFTEKFRMKANGSFAVNGNAGATGQVLQSNGSTGSPSWTNPTNILYNNTVQLTATGNVTTTQGGPSVSIPGFNYAFYSSGNSYVLLNFTIEVLSSTCTACLDSHLWLELYVDNVFGKNWRLDVNNGTIAVFSGSYLVSVGAGTHILELKGASTGPDTVFAYSAGSGTNYGNNMILQIIPQ